MTHCPGSKTAITRRQALQMASSGFGYTALSALLSSEAGAGTHFKPKAKKVVFLFMPGGVSHMESFDPKPKLTEMDGKPAKLDNYVAGPNRRWLGPLWSFKRYGQCGAPVSELFPHIAGSVDDLAIIRSMKSEFPLHARGNIFLHTGRNIGGFPSLGSWINYGLGSLNNNLPGYVLLRDASIPPGGIENYSNGFLPATHQATMIRDEGAPVENIAPADSNAVQRAKLDALLEQDRSFLGQTSLGQTGDGAIDRPSATMKWRIECNPWFLMCWNFRRRAKPRKSCMAWIPKTSQNVYMDCNACGQGGYWKPEFVLWK